MLTITVGATDVYDEETESFGSHGGCKLRLEHSLVSLSKWEAKHEKPFLSDAKKTSEEVLSYVECMLIDEIPLGENPPQLSEANLREINEYIDAKMTATWFSEVAPETRRSSEVITSELIYYWMTVFHIEWEAQHWHLNRLFTLIKICNVKQSKPKKMSRADVARRQRELNAQRRSEFGSRG